MRTAKESSAIRRIMAEDHPVDVIQNIFIRSNNILDIFKVVRKNSLEDVLLCIRTFYNKAAKKEIP